MAAFVKFQIKEEKKRRREEERSPMAFVKRLYPLPGGIRIRFRFISLLMGSIQKYSPFVKAYCKNLIEILGQIYSLRKIKKPGNADLALKRGVEKTVCRLARLPVNQFFNWPTGKLANRPTSVTHCQSSSNSAGLFGPRYCAARSSTQC